MISRLGLSFASPEDVCTADIVFFYSYGDQGVVHRRGCNYDIKVVLVSPAPKGGGSCP